MNQKVYDDGDLRKYRTEIPNMADDDLDPYQYRLYAHYKRVGNCWESVTTTADKCRMSRSKVIETRNWLHDNGWIVVEHRDNTTCLVSIVDRWGDNFLRYAKTTPQYSSPNMDYPSPNMDYPSPNMDSKKEPINKEPIKKAATTPPATRRRATPEHMVVAEKHGLTPRQMTALVDAVLDVTGQLDLANTDSIHGERALADAQEAARALVQMGKRTPEDVHHIYAVFKSHHPTWHPVASQIAKYANHEMAQAQPTFSEERRGVNVLKFSN